MADKSTKNSWRMAYELEGAAFGAADGVICLLGLIFGVAIATQSASLTIIAALAGGVADAFGNSIGFFISQSTERGVQIQRRGSGHVTDVHSKRETILNGVFSFITTIIVLFMLIVPFLFLDVKTSLVVSTAIGVIILLTLGAFVAGLTGESKLKTALTFVVLGMAGVAVGFAVGSIFKV